MICVPQAHSFCALTLLMDLHDEDISLIKLYSFFIAFTLVGLMLLITFSIWFANRAMRPIVQNDKEQQ